MRIPSKVSTRTDELSGGGHRIRLHSRQGGQVPWIGRISPHSAAGSSFPSPWCDSCSTPGNLEPHPMRRSRPIEKDYAFEIPTAQERMRRTTCLRADVVIRQGKGPRQALTGCKCTRTFCARVPAVPLLANCGWRTGTCALAPARCRPATTTAAALMVGE